MKRRASAVVVSTLAGVLAAGPADAHEVGLSRGDYIASGSGVTAQVVFARRELIGLVATLDGNGDGTLTEAETEAAREAVEGALVGRIRVQADGIPCPGRLGRVELVDQDGATVHARYRCPHAPKKLGIELAFLADLPSGHLHVARASAGPAVADRVLSPRYRSLSLDVPEGVLAEEPAPEATPPLWRGVLRALAQPWTPAFLVALLAGCPDRRRALLAVSAFVAAATAGLFLGARGLFLPSPRALGLSVALSLVYVGLEALASRARFTAWSVALPFGIVHGLAAATFQTEGAAGPLGLLATLVALSWAATGAVLIPVTRWLQRVTAPSGRGSRTLGAAVAVAGVVGLVRSWP